MVSTSLLEALLLAVTLSALVALGMVVMEWFKERRIARITAELNRAEAELRMAILQAANELGADAHEARKALIRVSYLASGHTPDEI